MSQVSAEENRSPLNGEVGYALIDIPHPDDGSNPDEIRAKRLFEIKANRELNLLLEEWEKQLKNSKDLKQEEESRLKNAKVELYQWIGFYSVFQGVVLTVVAQSNTLGCWQSWGPTSLSLLASVVTIVTVHFKLLGYGKLKTDLGRKIIESKLLHEQIEELKTLGTEFHFSFFA